MASQNEKKGALGGAASGAAAGSVAGPWGAAIGGVVGGIGGFFGGGAADEAEQLAEDQAKFSQMETKENIRRMRLAASQQVGASRAASYASNIQGGSGTAASYASKLRQQWKSDINWERDVGNRKADLLRKGGQDVSSGIMNSMFLQQAGTALNAATSFAGSGGFSQSTAGDTYSIDQRPQFAPRSLGA